MFKSSMESGDILDSRYCIEGLIGGGPRGFVVRAREISSARTVALKLYYSQRSFELVSTGHPNLLEPERLGVARGLLYTAMEYCPAGSLKENAVVLVDSEDSAVYMMVQIAQGLEALHKIGLCHQNIRLSNVLLGENNSLKLGDFLPQLHVTESRDELMSADIQALGCLFFEILCSVLDSSELGQAAERFKQFRYGAELKALLEGMIGGRESRFFNCTEVVLALRSLYR